MTVSKVKKEEYGNPELAHIFNTGSGKFNTSIELTEEDRRNKTLVYSHEPYAPVLFNAYCSRISGTLTANKDLRVDDMITVTAKSYNPKTKLVHCEGVDSAVLVIVPFSEFVYDLNTIAGDFQFSVVITKTESGSYVATCKNPTKYKEELEEAFRNNTWFNVKLIELIRGGYRALYKGTIECFIPGSHAAANIVESFEELIGKEMPVMVDNYDWSSRMYVVSYKKYVRNSLPTRVHEIKFGHKYKGRLTSNPTEYGLFIEFENYYTGLAHKIDFENYDEISKKYKVGDVIDVYVKNITEKKGNYRIVLTLNEADIDKEKLTWYKFKTTGEGKVLDYTHDEANKRIAVTLQTGESITISLPHNFETSQLEKYNKIDIHSINVLKQEINFDFCT